MGIFFGMSKGEFVGTASLLLIILALLAFNLFYVRVPKPQPDLTAFADRIAAFEEQQATYADSVAAARAARDSAYAARHQPFQGAVFLQHQRPPLQLEIRGLHL